MSTLEKCETCRGWPEVRCDCATREWPSIRDIQSALDAANAQIEEAREAIRPFRAESGTWIENIRWAVAEALKKQK